MRLLLLSMSVLLFACGGASNDEADGDTIGAEIADDYNEAMDKAKDVEEQLQQAKDDVDEALEEVEDAIDD